MRVRVCGQFVAGAPELIKGMLPEHNVLHLPLLDELYKLTDAECIIVRQGLITEQVFKNNPDLKAVIRWGSGYDSVDLEAANRYGVMVANLPGANAYAVAELTVALMVILSRRIMEFYRSCRSGCWQSIDLGSRSHTLNNCTVGIIGGGNIGRMVAERVQVFGARTIYYDIVRLPEAVEKGKKLTFVSLEALIRESDVITLAVPKTDSTFHMIDEKRLEMMKENVLIINTSRNGLIDDKALLESLKKHPARGAALDSPENRESETTRQLFELPNVIITPHIGGTASDLDSVMASMAAGMVKELADSGKMKYVVN